jgi:hypothetical protein
VEIQLQHDRQLELNILALCYQHTPRCLPGVVEHCGPEHFHFDDLRAIYKRMLEINDRGEDVRSNLLLKHEGLSRSAIGEIQACAVPATDPSS